MQWGKQQRGYARLRVGENDDGAGINIIKEGHIDSDGRYGRLAIEEYEKKRGGSGRRRRRRELQQLHRGATVRILPPRDLGLATISWAQAQVMNNRYHLLFLLGTRTTVYDPDANAERPQWGGRRA